MGLSTQDNPLPKATSRLYMKKSYPCWPSQSWTHMIIYDTYHY